MKPEEQQTLPLLSLRDLVVFSPHDDAPFLLGGKKASTPFNTR